MKKYWIHCQTYDSFLVEAKNKDEAVKKWQNGEWINETNSNYEIEEIEEIEEKNA